MSRTRVAFAFASSVLVVALTTVAAVDQFPIGAPTAVQASDTPYQSGSGVSLPKVIREVKPDYTQAALQAKVQGTVMMKVVVLATGEVGDVEVVKSLDREYGLDDQAVEAARQWQFEPGRKDGKAVPVQVALEMTFTLRE